MMPTFLEQPVPDVGARPYDPRFAPVHPLVLAGFWRRLVAYLIDSLIVGIPTRLVGRLLPFPAIDFIVTTLTAAAYFVILWEMQGQTIGYQAMRLRLVSTDGRTVGWGRAIVRYLVMMVFLAMILFGLVGFIAAATAADGLISTVFLTAGVVLCAFGILDFAIVAWDPGKRAWHDKAAGTLVIRV